jgi:hypothetical protein
LTACPPEKRPNGERGKLLFTFDGNDLILIGPLAEGSYTTVRAGDSTLVFSSSDPTVLEVGASGSAQAVAPGSAEVIASQNGVEVDRIAITVMRPDRVEIVAAYQGGAPYALLAPGFAQAIRVTRSAGDTALFGSGGWDVVALGSAVGTTGGAWSWLDDGRGDVYFIAATPGDGTVTATTAGGASAIYALRGVTEADVDEVVELSREAAGGNQQDATVRLNLVAKSGGVPIGGVHCGWTVSGGYVGLDSIEPDGTLDTDISAPRGSSAVATCSVGNIAPAFSITP